MMNKILFSLLAIITIANTAYSQIKTPVKWNIGIEYPSKMQANQ